MACIHLKILQAFPSMKHDFINSLILVQPQIDPRHCSWGQASPRNNMSGESDVLCRGESTDPFPFLEIFFDGHGSIRLAYKLPKCQGMAIKYKWIGYCWLFHCVKWSRNLFWHLKKKSNEKENQVRSPLFPLKSAQNLVGSNPVV